MPAVSQAQRAFIFAKFGKAFAKQHHFDNKGPLPRYVHEGVATSNGSRAPSKRKLKQRLKKRGVYSAPR